MNNHRKTHFLTLTLALLAATCVSAQTNPSIPVPSQFATSKTAFLAYAGAPAQTLEEKQMATMFYQSMYRRIASAKLYRMTSTPAQSELSMSTSIEVGTGPFIFIRLAVYDTKTHSLLCNIDEPIDGAFRKRPFKKISTLPLQKSLPI